MFMTNTVQISAGQTGEPNANCQLCAVCVLIGCRTSVTFSCAAKFVHLNIWNSVKTSSESAQTLTTPREYLIPAAQLLCLCFPVSKCLTEPSWAGFVLGLILTQPSSSSQSGNSSHLHLLMRGKKRFGDSGLWKKQILFLLNLQMMNWDAYWSKRKYF